MDRNSTRSSRNAKQKDEIIVNTLRNVILQSGYQST